MARAAVLTGIDQPLEIRDDVQVDAPRAGELKIRMAAAGVCHSDLSVQNGTLPLPTPMVLGHEGAGIVEEVGDGVTTFKPGDHVVVTFVPNCGDCYFCAREQGYLCDKYGAVASGGLIDGTTRFTSDGSPLYQMSMCGLFADETVIPAISAVKIPDDIPLTAAGLIGCGVLTGVGAALNTAAIRSGDTVAVLGCGGVGLNTIQGARIAGAGEIIAIDMNPTKLEMTKQFGATQTINAADEDPVGRVMELTGQRGADVAFEVIGLGPTIDQTITMIRKGGQAVLVGVPRMDVMVNLPAAFAFLYLAKSITGCWYGSSEVQRDVPKLIELYQSGDLKLDELVSRTIKLDDVNEAFEVMKTGEVARSVIEFSS